MMLRLRASDFEFSYATAYLGGRVYSVMIYASSYSLRLQMVMIAEKWLDDHELVLD